MLTYHLKLLADDARLSALRTAIGRLVRPGDVVLDAGTGTGVLAFFACQAGARRVYAVECEDIIHVAREVAEANGYGERIVFIQGDAQSLSLPEPVDVLVSDLIGVIGLDQNILSIYRHLVAADLLREGARVLPRSIRVMLAPWQDRSFYSFLDLAGGNVQGVSFGPIRERLMNQLYSTCLDPAGQLADPRAVWNVALPPDPEPARFTANETFPITRAGQLNGIGGWFRAELCPDVTLETTPGEPLMVWNQGFIPLSQPVQVEPGDQFELTLSATTRGSVTWHWSGSIRRGAEELLRFSHSTVLGWTLPVSTLGVAARDRMPTRSTQGNMLRYLLDGMDGQRSPRSLAQQLLTKFPDQLADLDQADEQVLSAIEAWGDRTTRPSP